MQEAVDLKSCERLFGENPDLRAVSLQGKVLSREMFFQMPDLWLKKKPAAMEPEEWVQSGEVWHPKRPSRQLNQVQYSRFIFSIGKTLSFRVVDPDQDIKIFHEWQNQPRVFEFWELNKSEADLYDYLLKGSADPHQIPMFVECEGVPVGYFEMYWTMEDRLGPYYEADAFDRGFHFLIGDERFLGLQNTDAVIKSACHFLFLDDPRTRNVMAEPRSDNKKVLKYVDLIPAWRKLKEFDFPHKRAALLECRRERFFLGPYL